MKEEYCGYTAEFEFIPERSFYTGRVLGLKKDIVFCGNSMEDVKKNFYWVVDEYIDTHGEFVVTKDKDFDGQISLEI